ncbi:MAG: 1-deoxy-D-xylulose-5-phosphate reductoisomerase [Armatimonadetes bacterium]|nr:1-deoxy-D-xylulose-5-phosphate reductoisomerase [Armatimonadota bacterium]
MQKRIAILGSTGSIGRQVLDVVDQFPDRLAVVALVARSDMDQLLAQARRYQPRFVALSEPPAGAPRRWDGGPIRLGADVLAEAATLPEADLVVIAVVGTAGLPPALAALNAGKDVALATKEALVVGGHLLTAAAARTGARLLPIDSEHSAIFQCLQGSRREEIEKITLTASGGPFVDAPAEALARVTPADALCHPTWRMGPKITVDSATLMNKGLEVIEARWLFGVLSSQIEIVIHRQSIVHSFVQFQDGSVLAQLSPPDMRLPIQYALFYPERVRNWLPRLDLVKAEVLTFEAPDTERFPTLKLAYRAATAGGSLPTVLSAANEEAVHLFLQGHIRFTDIAVRVARAMDRHTVIAVPDFEEILQVDAWARRTARGED